MKRLIVAVMALTLCASLSFAQQSSKISLRPLVINTNQLSKFLALDNNQLQEVSDINAYFIEKQEEVFKYNTGLQEQKKKEAIYGNLKLMKEVLNTEQYRKYVALVNVTNNNYLQEEALLHTDLQFAKND
ncbi:hypothetical protein D0T51_07400 [Parabacteroides sp. 52]|uniref:hypothetical protein n=1 Tax=unclassified Parabacteroides TaxID=2649774 RepID=UPI0013D47F10|nr:MULTISPECIES: hypothetical protein [unclassified Parabacteroides]MDH6534834.1 hypothetical protein [Parabacteroides sp. PM5-20]NDV55553.1 hypothetical protein [Parabacteroides sp. 52]